MFLISTGPHYVMLIWTIQDNKLTKQKELNNNAIKSTFLFLSLFTIVSSVESESSDIISSQSTNGSTDILVVVIVKQTIVSCSDWSWYALRKWDLKKQGMKKKLISNTWKILLKKCFFIYTHTHTGNQGVFQVK